MYARLGKFNEAIAFLDNALKLLITPALKTDIGIIVIQENYPTVAAITAEAKGTDIKAGDKVTKINGQSTMGFDLNKTTQKLQETNEAQVTLTI